MSEIATGGRDSLTGTAPSLCATVGNVRLECVTRHEAGRIVAVKLARAIGPAVRVMPLRSGSSAKPGTSRKVGNRRVRSDAF